MLWFIVLRTAGNVWREWGTGRKSGRLKCVFLLSTAVSFFLLWVPDFWEAICSDPVLWVPLNVLLSLLMGTIALILYFLVNVFWCLVNPLAGIWWKLDEEEKKNKYVFFYEGRRGNW